MRKLALANPRLAAALAAAAALALVWLATTLLLAQDALRSAATADARAKRTANHISALIEQAAVAYEATVYAVENAYLQDPEADLKALEPAANPGQAHRPALFITDTRGRVVRSSHPGYPDEAQATFDLGSLESAPTPAHLVLGVPQNDPYTQEPVVPVLQALIERRNGQKLGWIIIALPRPLPLFRSAMKELGNHGFAILSSPAGYFRWSKEGFGAIPPPPAGDAPYVPLAYETMIPELDDFDVAARNPLEATHFVGEARDGYVKVTAAFDRDEALSAMNQRRSWTLLTTAAVSAVILAGLATIERLLRRMGAREKRMRRRASLDPTTQLFNRRGFQHAFGRMMRAALQAGERMALLYVDVQQPCVENGPGHADDVPRAMAKLLRAHCAPAAAICRISDTVFTVILPGVTDIESAHAAALAVDQAALQLPSAIGAPVLVSIGVHLCAVAEARSEATAKAQAAAVRAHRGQVRVRVYTPEMDVELSERRALAADLRDALSAHQLFVAYQPTVDLGSRKVFRYDAALQWHHPTHGLLPPAVFLPIARDLGLLQEIGEFLVDQCCAQLRTWFAETGQWAQVSFSVCTCLLFSDTLAQAISRALSRHRVPGSALWMELSETAAVESLSQAEQVLADIRAQGVKLTLGNFGAGRSALADIHRLRPSGISLPMLHASDAAAVRTLELLVSLAAAHQLVTVAKGVASRAQHDVLARAGCQYGQGDFYAPSAAPEPIQQALAA